MIDFGLKAEFEKEENKHNKRMLDISKDFNIFVEKMINKYQIASYELLGIYNSLAAIELQTRIKNSLEQQAKYNLSLKRSIKKN